MQVTAHFNSSEFDQPGLHGFAPEKYPEAWIVTRLRPLCIVLEALRARWGLPVNVTVGGGYRSAAYNRAIGGARASQHMLGRAADIVVPDVDPSVVHRILLEMYEDGLIHIGGLGAYPTFTHVDIRPGDRLARWTGSRDTNKVSRGNMEGA